MLSLQFSTSQIPESSFLDFLPFPNFSGCFPHPDIAGQLRMPEKLFSFKSSYKKPVSSIFFNFEQDIPELAGSTGFLFTGFFDSAVNPFFSFFFLSGIEQYSYQPDITA